jgi:hypothetical protein
MVDLEWRLGRFTATGVVRPTAVRRIAACGCWQMAGAERPVAAVRGSGLAAYQLPLRSATTSAGPAHSRRKAALAALLCLSDLALMQ